MALLQDLIKQVDDPDLRERILREVDKMSKQKKFGQCVTVSEESFDRETFEDGHIYFLNTQKLSVSSNLTKHGDGRTYTIWEANEQKNLEQTINQPKVFNFNFEQSGGNGKQIGYVENYYEKDEEDKQ